VISRATCDPVPNNRDVYRAPPLPPPRYAKLNRLDANIDAVAPSAAGKGTSGRTVPGLGVVSDLVEGFRKQHYLIAEQRDDAEGHKQVGRSVARARAPASSRDTPVGLLCAIVQLHSLAWLCGA
jgi:hypothetical protein